MACNALEHCLRFGVHHCARGFNGCHTVLVRHLRRDSAPGCDKPDLAAAVRADRQDMSFRHVLSDGDAGDLRRVTPIEVVFNLLPGPQKRKMQEADGTVFV